MAFGAPKQSYLDRDGEDWHIYDRVGEVSGELTIMINRKNGKISMLSMAPKNLSLKEAINLFGKGYKVTNYDYDDCVKDPKADALYESPTGFLQYIEYRDRGIALLLDERRDKIALIDYVSNPIGTPKPRCK